MAKKKRQSGLIGARLANRAKNRPMTNAPETLMMKVPNGKSGPQRSTVQFVMMNRRFAPSQL